MPRTRWTALPKYDPSSYSVSPSRYPGRLSSYARRPSASTVAAAMTMVTGSRQAAAKRERVSEPPAGASAPGFTVVPLTSLPAASVTGRRQYPQWTKAVMSTGPWRRTEPRGARAGHDLPGHLAGFYEGFRFATSWVAHVESMATHREAGEPAGWVSMAGRPGCRRTLTARRAGRGTRRRPFRPRPGSSRQA